jgi:hypothetical protein
MMLARFDQALNRLKVCDPLEEWVMKEICLFKIAVIPPALSIMGVGVALTSSCSETLNGIAGHPSPTETQAAGSKARTDSRELYPTIGGVTVLGQAGGETRELYPTVTGVSVLHPQWRK